jgi:hypothetical protein
MANENDFKAKLIKKLERMFPEAIIINLDPNSNQGIPDVLILEGYGWATLETKKQRNSDRQPNQSYWVNKMNKMSFSRFVSPENEEVVLDELQDALRN